MTKLSVNINKLATIRNARGSNNPDLLKAVRDIESFGAQGITVHPRPDERHIRYSDIPLLTNVITTEFNIEGIGGGGLTEARYRTNIALQPAKMPCVASAQICEPVHSA